MLKNKIILASASPRRKHLLETVGIPFEVMPAHVDEVVLKNPVATVLANSKLKALDIAKDHPDSIVLGVDTVVCSGNRILGKPDNAEHAHEMLRKLHGRRHDVYSGVCLAYQGDIHLKYMKTAVFFDTLTEQEIKFYVREHQPMDKAGAYGIQDFSSMFIRKVDGDYFNVVGLPMNLLYRMLKKIGYAFY